MNSKTSQSIFDKTNIISREILFANAHCVDRQNRFPIESFKAMKEIGLYKLLIPSQLGGIEANMLEVKELFREIGGGCLSSALIWSMHCQQIQILLQNQDDRFHPLLQNQQRIAMCNRRYRSRLFAAYNARHA